MVELVCESVALTRDIAHTLLLSTPEEKRIHYTYIEAGTHAFLPVQCHVYTSSGIYNVYTRMIRTEVH